MISPTGGCVNLVVPHRPTRILPQRDACRCHASACGIRADDARVAGRCPHTRKLRTTHAFIRRTTCPDCRGVGQMKRQPPYPVWHGGGRRCGTIGWLWHGPARDRGITVHFARNTAICYCGLRNLLLWGPRASPACAPSGGAPSLAPGGACPSPKNCLGEGRGLASLAATSNALRGSSRAPTSRPSRSL